MWKPKFSAWGLVCVCFFSLNPVTQAQNQGRGEPPKRLADAVVADPEAPRTVLQADSTTSVLRLIKFGGVLKDRLGHPRTGAVSLTVALYRESQGGSPLWLEMHNAQLDEEGRYTVLLGNTKSEGLPLDLFATGEARWLGVQVNLPGEEEQPRVLLVSVPYALKAADAEKLGGRPPSAFLLAEQTEGRQASGTKPEAGMEAVKEGPDRQRVISGTVGQIAKFVGPDMDDVGNSGITETADGDVGIGTTAPGAKLEVKAGSQGQGAPVTALKIWGPNTPANANSSQDLQWGFASAGSSRIRAYRGGAWDTYLQFLTNAFGQGSDSPQVRMHISENGTVGIGTTTPGAKLEVKAGSEGQGAPVTALKIWGPNTPANANSSQDLQWGFASAGSSRIRAYRGGAWDTYLQFLTNASGQGSDSPQVRMHISENGSVGIGSTTPAEKLDVAGNIRISGPTSNGLVFADGTTQTSAATGDITAVVASTGLTGGATSGVATLELSGGARSRGITYLAGCDSCGVLTNADDQKTFFQNVCDPVTINSITCFSDAGAPVINIQRQVGVAAPADVISGGMLTCSTTGASGTIVGLQSILNTGDKLDFQMVTADNVARRVTVVIKTTMN